MTAPVHVTFSCCILQKYHSVGGGDWQILSLLLRFSWWWTFSYTWCNWSRNFCISGKNNTSVTLHMSSTERLLDSNGAVSPAFLQKYDETRQIGTHPLIRTFHRQQELNWQDRRKLWQTRKYATYLKFYEDIIKILHEANVWGHHKKLVHVFCNRFCLRLRNNWTVSQCFLMDEFIKTEICERCLPVH